MINSNIGLAMLIISWVALAFVNFKLKGIIKYKNSEIEILKGDIRILKGEIRKSKRLGRAINV